MWQKPPLSQMRLKCQSVGVPAFECMLIYCPNHLEPQWCSLAFFSMPCSGPYSCSLSYSKPLPLTTEGLESPVSIHSPGAVKLSVLNRLGKANYQKWTLAAQGEGVCTLTTAGALSMVEGVQCKLHCSQSSSTMSRNPALAAGARLQPELPVGKAHTPWPEPQLQKTADLSFDNPELLSPVSRETGDTATACCDACSRSPGWVLSALKTVCRACRHYFTCLYRFQLVEFQMA